MMRAAVRILAVVLLTSTMARAQGSLLLVGGGGENYNDWSDVPYRWLVTHVPNGKILVLHYSDTTSFFSGYFPWLSPCTVANLVITSTAQANDSAVYRRILQHDGVFFRGGDQWQYVSKWRGTLAEKAVREIYTRGGIVGGTSAGEMVLSEIIFDAHLSSVAPRNALRNPLGASITLTDDFLGMGAGFLADSHFFERGRFGRLPAFLAVYQQLKGREIAGVGVDVNTAFAIGPDGVGEVMGSGTVTVLRYAPGTQTTLVPGEALSMTGIRFDQLTVGARMTLSSGVIQPPPDAFAYGVKPFGASNTLIILDGSNSSSDWSAATGSLRKLQSALHQPTDTVGIISSLTTPAAANSVTATLAMWGVSSRPLWIGEGTKDDPSFALSILSCRGFVFAGNSPDSLARFLDAGTQAGSALLTRVNAQSPLLFLSDDALLAGEQGISQMYRSIYGAYYGYLVSVKGLNVVRGMQIVSRLYESSDYIDNRASSVFWGMTRAHLPYGLLLDAGTHATILGGKMSIYGSTPAMLIDARARQWGSLPTFRDPGKVNPRQNGGIIGAAMHVLRDGEVFDLAGATGVDSKEISGRIPETLVLEQNYPNPFNPHTAIRYGLPRSMAVSLTVYNALGQNVAELVNGEQEAGMHEVHFNGNTCASGIYLCRLTAGDAVRSIRLLLLR
jgi:cyanophycinase